MGTQHFDAEYIGIRVYKNEEEADKVAELFEKAEAAASISPAITPTDTLQPKSFAPMLNGVATNQLTAISTRTAHPTIDAITGVATIESGTLKVFLDKYNELTGGLRISTHKLLHACIIALTEQNNYRGNEADINPNVVIPIERFMELCGIPLTKPSKDKTRRKLKEDLETLYHISLEWTEPSGKKTKDFTKMRLCDQIAISKGNILFSFSDGMANYLTHAYITQFPLPLLKVDERNPTSYHIGIKLANHASIDNNIRKGTANILSVKSLLTVCPEIPSYEEVMRTGRQLDQRVKVPFENALNSVPDLEWEYSNAKGTPLTEEQLKATTYSSFINLYIKFSFRNAPDQTPRLEARAEEAKTKALRKRNTSKKKGKTAE